MIFKIGTQQFKTKKKATDYVRDLIYRIKVTDSVKGKGNSYYEQLLEIARLHPESAVKLRNISDFFITRNRLNVRALQLNVKRLDGTVTDISWTCCIKGEPSDMTNLYAAFRHVVQDQTMEFRTLVHENATCELCSTHAHKFHVDHVVHFQQLVADFLTTTTLQVPTQFAECDDGTHRHTFLEADDAIARAFSDYHRRHAELRVLCATCNLSRTKYKPLNSSRSAFIFRENT